MKPFHILARIETGVLAEYAFLSLSALDLYRIADARETLLGLIARHRSFGELVHRKVRAEVLTGIPRGFESHGLAPEMVLSDGYLVLGEDFPAEAFVNACRDDGRITKSESEGLKFHSIGPMWFVCYVGGELAETVNLEEIILPLIASLPPSGIQTLPVPVASPWESLIEILEGRVAQVDYLAPERFDDEEHETNFRKSQQLAKDALLYARALTDPFCLIRSLVAAYGPLHDQVSSIAEQPDSAGILPAGTVRLLAGPCLAAMHTAGKLTASLR